MHDLQILCFSASVLASSSVMVFEIDLVNLLLALIYLLDTIFKSIQFNSIFNI